MIKRILKLLAILAVVAIFVVAAGLVGLVVGRSQNLTLPPPAGAYAVRRFITTWTDEARLENLGGTPGQHRTLSVQIWYPAEPGGVAVPYMPPDWARAREADRGIGSLLFQTVGSIHSNATDAGPSIGGGPFRVLIFEPGLGPLIPEYATLAEDLASRGYVVVGLNPTYSASLTVLNGQVIAGSSLGTIPDDATPEQAQQRGDELVAIWAADDRFAIDEAFRMNTQPGSPFAGRLDVHHVGLLGHSFGGAAALEACGLDARCMAADLDGSPYGNVVHTGLDRPLLLVLSESENNSNTPEMLKSARDLAAIFAKVPLGYQVTIEGARHFNYTDMALGFHPFARQLGVLGSIDGARGLRVTSEYVAAFFDQTLMGRSSLLLQGPSKDYPEVHLAFH